MGEQTRSGGTLAAQVAVAALFLAAIGGSVGLVLGLRDRPSQLAAHTATSPTAGPASTPSGKSCPAEAVDLVHRLGVDGAVTQVLYIHTERSEVWICQDARGKLYYQGHDYTLGAELNEGVNALFLSEVHRQDDGYLAVNPNGTGGTTTYLVTPQKLEIDLPGDKKDLVEEVTG
jgi:hypothetical protein